MVYQIQDNEMYAELPESPERVEGLMWMNYLLDNPNPVLVQGGIFLAKSLDVDVESEIEEMSMMKLASLDPLEMLEAQLLTKFYQQHSNELLCELADWIPQWLDVDPPAK
jgi:hypothetical protein